MVAEGARDLDTEAPRGPAEPQRRSKSRKLKILLVDDHSEVRSTTAAVLKDPAIA